MQQFVTNHVLIAHPMKLDPIDGDIRLSGPLVNLALTPRPPLPIWERGPGGEGLITRNWFKSFRSLLARSPPTARIGLEWITSQRIGEAFKSTAA
jgi:hypothetical protein